jgi:hypothetical protein
VQFCHSAPLLSAYTTRKKGRKRAIFQKPFKHIKIYLECGLFTKYKVIPPINGWEITKIRFFFFFRTVSYMPERCPSALHFREPWTRTKHQIDYLIIRRVAQHPQDATCKLRLRNSKYLWRYYTWRAVGAKKCTSLLEIYTHCVFRAILVVFRVRLPR